MRSITIPSEPISKLLVNASLMELGPGSAKKELNKAIQSIEFPDNEFGKGCLAGLWLRFNFHDESHAISQEMPNQTGAYWHGILHRREPDAWNSKYWFNRVRQHTIFDELAQDAKELGYHQSEKWDPVAFIDRIEAARGRNTKEESILLQVQDREWQLLFEWCWNRSQNWTHFEEAE
jgi:hypothetical protein